MFKEVRLAVSLWILLILVTFREDICLVTQFWTTEQPLNHISVPFVKDSSDVTLVCDDKQLEAHKLNLSYLDLSVGYSTDSIQSCVSDRTMAPNLSNEQKMIVKSLYKKFLPGNQEC